MYLFNSRSIHNVPHIPCETIADPEGGGPGFRTPPPSRDLSKVRSCVEVWLVGEGVQWSCLTFLLSFFYKHITCTHTSEFNALIVWNGHPFSIFPYPNYEMDPTYYPLLYDMFIFFYLELHDLTPFKLNIFWGRTPTPHLPSPTHSQYQNYHVIRVFVKRGLQSYKWPFPTDNKLVWKVDLKHISAEGKEE